MEFMILKCKDCPNNIISRQYSTLNELLEHHFLRHEKELPEATKDRLNSSQTIRIGFPNTKTWTNVLGDTFYARDHHAQN